VEVGVDVCLDKPLQGLGVGVVVVDDENRGVVVCEVAVRGGILRGRAVIEHHEERQFLPVPGATLQCEVQVPRDILQLVVGGLARQALEEVSPGLGVEPGLRDELLEGVLQRYTRTQAVAVGVVTHPDRPAGEQRRTEPTGNLPEFVAKVIEDSPLDERVHVGGCDEVRAVLGEAVADPVCGRTVEDSQVVGFELWVAVAFLDGPGRADDIVVLDGRERTHAGLVEGSRRKHPALGPDLEDCGAAGLFDLDDPALDVDRLAGKSPEVGGRGAGPWPGLAGLVGVELYLDEADIALGPYLVEFDHECVTHLVGARKVRCVYQSGHRRREVDEHAVVDNTVDCPTVPLAVLDILDRTCRREIVDDRQPVVAGALLRHTCCRTVRCLYPSTFARLRRIVAGTLGRCKLPRPTPSLTQCARSVLEDGAFRGFRHLLSHPRVGRGVDARRRFAGGSVRPNLATPHQPSKAVRDGRPKTGVVGSLGFNSRWTRTGTCAVQGRALVPEFGAGLRRPVHRVRFGSDVLLCAWFARAKRLANALPPRPTRSLRSLVEAGASALPRGDTGRVVETAPTRRDRLPTIRLSRRPRVRGHRPGTDRHPPRGRNSPDTVAGGR